MLDEDEDGDDQPGTIHGVFQEGRDGDSDAREAQGERWMVCDEDLSLGWKARME